VKRWALFTLALGLFGACGRGVWADPGQYFSSLSDESKWAAFDISTVSPSARGYLGGVYDGRYLYFVPYYNGGPHGDVARYDTTLAFGSRDAWSIFDVSTINVDAKQFEGAAFDGRFVYFVPVHGTVARYDAQAPFEAAGSWSTFDVTIATGGTGGFATGVFDGRRIYFAPWSNQPGVYHGLAVSYDTQGSFDVSGGWSMVDVSTLDASAVGFAGSVFDGRYIYYAPASGFRVVFARFDTQSPFESFQAWSTIDLTAVAGYGSAFNGTAFDGRYVYFAPFTGGRVFRCDTQRSFDAAAWSTFDVAAVDGRAQGFSGAAFDGRYVYLTPYFNGVSDGVVTRYDSEQEFTSPGAWSLFDVTTIAAGAKGFSGAVFDGRYVTFVPNTNELGASGVVARFDAKIPRSFPLGWTPSFF
jgi:hypothetical protein